MGLLQTESLSLGSPFDYQRQARLILPRGMPDPADDPASYERQVVEMIRRYVGRSDGHAFVLFTSYEMMKRAAAALGALAGRAESGVIQPGRRRAAQPHVGAVQDQSAGRAVRRG